MLVNLHVDLETLQLIQGPGQRGAVSSLRFKRGDAAKLRVVFYENGTTPVIIGNPSGLEIQIGIKLRNQFDQSYLAQSTDWTMPAEGDDTPTYECDLGLNTLQLNSALNVGSADELPEINLMGEITWREDGGTSTSTRTFLVVVENDVNRGTEGIPSDASPPYPLPEELELQANKGTANGYAGLDATGKLPVAAVPTHTHAALTGPGDPTKKIQFGGGGLTSDGTTPVVFPALLEAPNYNGKPQYSTLGDSVLQLDGGSNHRCYYVNQLSFVIGQPGQSYWILQQISPSAAWRGPINGNEAGPENVLSWTPMGTNTGAPFFIAPTFIPPQGTHIGQLYLNTSNDQLHYWDGNSWKNSAGATQTTSQRLAQSATAFRWGPEDTTPADNDRLAVVSPTAGWLSLTRLWTYIAGRINTLSGAFTVGGNWSFTGQTQLASTQSANDPNSAMTLGLVAARDRLTTTGTGAWLVENDTQLRTVIELPVKAGKTYIIKYVIVMEYDAGTSVGGMKYAMIFPAGQGRFVRSRANLLTPIMTDATLINNTVALVSERSVLAFQEGWFQCEADGQVELQFAKNAANVGVLKIRNTSLRITEV